MAAEAGEEVHHRMFISISIPPPLQYDFGGGGGGGGEVTRGCHIKCIIMPLYIAVVVKRHIEIYSEVLLFPLLV